MIIPRSNVHHLMLRDEVIETVSAGRFHIWAVATIDEGLELLTGVPAGHRGADGEFADETLHRGVEERLRSLAETARGLDNAQPPR